MRWLGVALAVALLAGCFDVTDDFYHFDPNKQYRNPGVFPGDYLQVIPSQVLVKGNLTALPVETIRLVSQRPAYMGLVPTDQALVEIPVAFWRPNTTEKVPIIVDAGPYFEQKDDAINAQLQLTPFTAGNFLPHGYAVAQIAVRGTGTAGGCLNLLGAAETADVQQAIDWLAEQPWSNGNVAMIGGSYDGATPWDVAATGDVHVKTIIPMEGFPSLFDMMFHNGSSEGRAANMHDLTYWRFGFSKDLPQRPPGWPEAVPWPAPPVETGWANGRKEYQDRQNLVCPEMAQGVATGWYSVLNGDRAAAASPYWTERDYRQRVLDNYKGSVFLVHGLQDWNINPHSVVPFNRELRAHGLEVKEWYGQWAHDSPDVNCRADAPSWAVVPCRLDFGETLLHWLDHYLKGNDADLGPQVQVQDNVGFWRNAEAFPPTVPDWVTLHLTADGRLSAADGTSGTFTLTPDPEGPGPIAKFVSEPLAAELHVSGLNQLKLPFEVSGPGGEAAAFLFDLDAAGRARAQTVTLVTSPGNGSTWEPTGFPAIGYAQMDLRYWAGGDEPEPLVPGQRHVAQVEFEPAESRIPAGHRLALWIMESHYEDNQDSATRGPVTLHLDGDAQLRLSTVQVEARTVFPVPGVHFLDHTDVPQMYIPIPELASLGVAGAIHDGRPPSERAGPQAPLPADCTGCVRP